MNAKPYPQNRWIIAIAGTILMICLGTVYAWSFYQGLLCHEFQSTYGWSNAQVAWIFSLAIFFLGVTAAWAGARLRRSSPRAFATTGAVLFAAGYAIAAFAFSIKSLLLLYAGYGVIGGIGLGLGYVTPVAVVSKWFPDRKGLATGMVVMGFGLGALFMSKILAPRLLDLTGRNLSSVFLILGGIFLVLGLGSASFIRNPPTTAPAAFGVGRAPAEMGPMKAVFSRRFLFLWLVFFCNITAGIAIISFQSMLFQNLWKALHPDLAAATLTVIGATLVAISSLFNGGGRFLWGALSDKLGRSQTFRVMLASEIAVFALLVITRNPWVFAVLVCWVLLCYGGGFGTMPSFIGDVFGPRLMPAVYGAVLTAWAAAGIAGPQIFAAFQDRLPAGTASTWSFIVAGGFVAVGLVLAFLLTNTPLEGTGRVARRAVA